MTTTVPTADWNALFKELPVAIEQLRSFDAYSSREAALLLDGGLFALKALDPARTWDELVPLIGMLAVDASDHRRDELPQHTLDFLDRIEDAFSDWNTNVRDTDEVLSDLSNAGSGDATRPH